MSAPVGGWKTPLAQVAMGDVHDAAIIATCAGGVFHPPTGADIELTLGQLAVCGGIKNQIHAHMYIMLQILAPSLCSVASNYIVS